jgi:hypothetical protein
MLESKEKEVLLLNVVSVDLRAASAGAAVVAMNSAASTVATNFTISSKWSLLFVKGDCKI